MIGYIYEIVCKDPTITKVYIGSCWNIYNRKICHKSSCNNKNIPLYQYIRENGGWDNFNMNEVYCESGLETIRDRETIEQYYIDMNGGIKNLLNGQDAIMNKEQRKNAIKNRGQRNRDSKRFYCCGYSFQSNYDLQRHIKSKNHYNKINNILPLPKICIPCNKSFRTNCELQRHQKTKNHLRKINLNNQ